MKKIFRIVVVLVLTAGLFSCRTVKETYSEKTAYSPERTLSYNIENINNLSETNLTQAIVQSKLLMADNPDSETVLALYEGLVGKLQTRFNGYYEKKDYLNALSDYNSLTVLGVPTENITLDKINSGLYTLWTQKNYTSLVSLFERKDNVKAEEGKAPPSEKVSELIEGTVTIWVDRGIRLQQGRGVPERVIGSGFFIEESGYIITNYHVISSEVDPEYEGFSRMYIKLSENDNSRIPAKVIGWDEVLDLALIKAEIKAPYVFSLGSSDDLDVGDIIYAIGSPGGLEKTLTSGIVSSINRRFLSMGSIMQIDAAINQGNSGGPIIDQKGRVQAVVFAGIENFEGLNFAIPVEYLKLILPYLFEGGEVSHPWIGAYGQNYQIVGDTGEISTGAEILYTLPGSPSDLGGITEPVKIVSCNGRKIYSLQDLQNNIISFMPGTIINLTDSEGKDYFISLDKRPDLPGKEILEKDVNERAFIPLFGMKLDYTGGKLWPRYTINSVVPGGIADESGLSVLDPITVRKVDVDEDSGYVFIQFDIKKRKGGYMEVVLALAAPLDSPDYL